MMKTKVLLAGVGCITLLAGCGNYKEPLEELRPVGQVLVQKEKLILTLPGAHFAFDKAIVSATDREAINDLITTLKSKKLTGDLRVAGYTDSIGSASYNIKLSQRRAAAVAKTLKTGLSDYSGIKAVRTQGFGETHPVASNKTKAGRAKNRRVEIYLGGHKVLEEERVVSTGTFVDYQPQGDLSKAGTVEVTMNVHGNNGTNVTPGKYQLKKKTEISSGYKQETLYGLVSVGYANKKGPNDKTLMDKLMDRRTWYDGNGHIKKTIERSYITQIDGHYNVMYVPIKYITTNSYKYDAAGQVVSFKTKSRYEEIMETKRETPSNAMEGYLGGLLKGTQLPYYPTDKNANRLHETVTK